MRLIKIGSPAAFRQDDVNWRAGRRVVHTLASIPLLRTRFSSSVLHVSKSLPLTPIERCGCWTNRRGNCWCPLVMASFQRLQERLEVYRQAKARQKREQEPTITSKKEQMAELSDEKLTEPSNRKGNDVRTSEANRTNQNSTPDIAEKSSPWWMIGLKVLLWLALFGFFVEIEFGVVFVLSSILFFIYTSMRRTKRRSSELSAYSVFNKNFERIEGTLTADQFERELRLGPGSVR